MRFLTEIYTKLKNFFNVILKKEKGRSKLDTTPKTQTKPKEKSIEKQDLENIDHDKLKNDSNGKQTIKKEEITKDLLKFEEDIKENDIPEEKIKKKQKPYPKKTPIERGKIKERKRENSLETNDIEEKKTVYKDLGRKSAKSKRPTKVKEIASIKKVKKEETRISTPFIELNFSNYQINLVIPKQKIKLKEPSEEFMYQIVINDKKFHKSAKVSKIKDDYCEVEKIEIELEKPLLNFQVTYPKEFRKTEYTFSYFHRDKFLYVFSGRYQNKAKMIELWDQQGNFNLIPRKKLWILHPDMYELEMTPNIIEDLWIWDYDNIKFLDLRDKFFISLRNNENNDIKKYLCDAKFYLEGQQTRSDDYEDDFPLFNGQEIAIFSLKDHPNGLDIWLLNKEIKTILLEEDWKGSEPIILKCPDDLNFESGSFQIQICTKGNRIPIETLDFRYLPSIQLDYPRELLIPNEIIGHKNEIINITLEDSMQQWKLKTSESVEVHNSQQNKNFIISVPEVIDCVNISLIKNDELERKIDFEITIPRLKWRIGNENEWGWEKIEINRENLTSGVDFPLEIATNDYKTPYKIRAILKDNLEELQEIKLKKRSINFSCELNPFFTTIISNDNKLTLFLNIVNIEDEREYECCIIIFPKVSDIIIKALYEDLIKFSIKFEENIYIDSEGNYEYNVRGIDSHYKKFCSEHGYSFSKEQLFEVLTLSFKLSQTLEVPGKIFKMISTINKKIRREFIEHLPGMFKNVILDQGNTGIKIKNRVEFLEFVINFEIYFGIVPPLSSEILQAIFNQERAVNKILNNNLYYKRIRDIFRNNLDRIEDNFKTKRIKLLKRNLRKSLNKLIYAKRMNKNYIYQCCCGLCNESAKIMLKAYLFFKEITPIYETNFSIKEMYFMAFNKEFSKFLDNFNKYDKDRNDFSVRQADYALKLAEQTYREIKKKENLFEYNLNNLKKKRFN